MAPDLNSLPPSSPDMRPSRAMSSNANNNNNGDVSPSPSPRSASTSLQAAAALNLGLQRGEPVRNPASSSSSLSQRALQSSTTGRRRSQVLMNLQIADPSIPAPGEMVDPPAHGVASFRSSSPQPLSQSPRMMPSTDPRHSRAPSLGELHQELENEQEFQVNRLLQEIRRLQVQVQRQQSGQSSEEAILDRSGPIPIQTSSLSGSAPASAYPHYSSSVPRSPVFPRSSFDMARADLHRRSRTPSRGASPRLRATSISGESGDQFALGGRDESSFYQAETQMLMRENQMLRHRIRELERQLSEAGGSGSTGTHDPPQSSHLHRSTSVSEEDSRGYPTAPAIGSLLTVADVPKEE